MSLIQDLKDGKVCLRNDGTPAQLEMVIKKAFPQDGRNVIPYWRYLYWGKHPLIYNSYGWSDDSSFFGGVPCIRIQSFVDQIARDNKIVISNDSLEKAIRDLKFRANEIGLDVQIVFRQREKR